MCVSPKGASQSETTRNIVPSRVDIGTEVDEESNNDLVAASARCVEGEHSVEDAVDGLVGAEGIGDERYREQCASPVSAGTQNAQWRVDTDQRRLLLPRCGDLGWGLLGGRVR